MPHSKTDDWIACTAVTAIVAAFGTVFLLPALRTWSDRVLLWWLFYVLASAMALGIGKNPVAGIPRFLIASMAGLMPALYVAFQVLIRDTLSLSGLSPRNPRFWAVVAVMALASWCFVWLFSYARTGIKTALEALMTDTPEKRINALSRTVTAAIGLLGVIGILVTKLMPT